MFSSLESISNSIGQFLNCSHASRQLLQADSLLSLLNFSCRLRDTIGCYLCSFPTASFFRHLYPPLVLPLRQEGTHTHTHTDLHLTKHQRHRPILLLPPPPPLINQIRADKHPSYLSHTPALSSAHLSSSPIFILFRFRIFFLQGVSLLGNRRTNRHRHVDLAFRLDRDFAASIRGIPVVYFPTIPIDSIAVRNRQTDTKYQQETSKKDGAIRSIAQRFQAIPLCSLPSFGENLIHVVLWRSRHRASKSPIIPSLATGKAIRLSIP